MTTMNLTDRDVRVRDAVLKQLEWDPEVDAGGIGVTASKGAVTLTGTIGTYAAKLAAERAAKRVRGVRAVANDLNVRLLLERTDADIAADVTRSLEMCGGIPSTVQAVVHHGRVTLTGQVNWLFQKHAAEKALRHIRGVRAVLNYIAIAPRAIERDAQHRIAEALHRQASIDAHRITVATMGDKVILTGTVTGWWERDAAERAAAGAPGVADVDNRLIVEPHGSDADDWEIC